MMRKIKYLFTAAFFLLVALGTAAQEPSAIVFNGILTSAGAQMANRDFNIDFFMVNEASEPLLARNVTVSTDSSGQFAFYIRDIPAVFTSGARIPSVKMVIAIHPADTPAGMGLESTRVEYTLRRTGLGGYTITRMDNQVLEQSFEQQVWSFWDVAPHAYLSGSFYISFYKNLTDINHIYQVGWQLKQQHQQVPGAVTVPPPQRGIKGGYAVGGYKKEQ